MKLLAIDPGSRYVAMVVREFGVPKDQQVADWLVLDRKRDLPDRADPFWLDECVGQAMQLRDHHEPQLTVVEEATAPNPHMGMTNPGPIIVTAMVVGAMVAALDAYVFPTGSYGAPVPNRRILTAAYPKQLVGARETTGSGKGTKQHARAAYDLAGAAYQQLRYIT